MTEQEQKAFIQMLDALEHIQRCIGFDKATIHQGSATWCEIDDAITAANAVSHPQTTEPAAKKLIGWRTADYLRETDVPQMAMSWDVHYEILPIFEGDANTKLTAAPKAQTTEPVRLEALNKLGKRLAELLDEDQWAECEKLLISLRGEQPVIANAVQQNEQR